MAFGIFGNTARINLRNWLTLLLRECILEQEGIAYKNNQGVFKLIYCADGTFLEYDENMEHFTLPNIFPHL